MIKRKILSAEDAAQRMGMSIANFECAVIMLDYLEKGEERGELRGQLKVLNSLVEDKILSIEDAAEKVDMTVELFQEAVSVMLQ